MQTQTDSLNYHFGLDTDAPAGSTATAVAEPSISANHFVASDSGADTAAKKVVASISSASSMSSKLAAAIPTVPSVKPVSPTNFHSTSSPSAPSKILEPRCAKLNSHVDNSPRQNFVLPIGGIIKAVGALLIIGGIAAVCFNLFKSANSTLPDAMKSVGDVAVLVGARPLAMEIYNANLKDPKYVTVLVEWGNTSRAHGRPEDALAYLNKAIAINPEYPLAYINRGAVYLDMDDWQHAIADDTKAISLNSDYAMGYNNRACTYLNMGKPALAISDFNKAIEREPGTTRFWVNRGNCYMQMKQYKQAMQNYDYAIAHGNAQAVSLKQQAQAAMAPVHATRLAHAKKHTHKSTASK